jgi:hypothetical protein
MLRDILPQSDAHASPTNVEHIAVHDGAADRIVIPDTNFLFSAAFSRSGSDLILSGADGKMIVLDGYFNSDKHPDLISPDGAVLNADLVARLAGPEHPGQYAQVGAPAGGTVIGHVDRMSGHATAQHANGVVTDLNIGDNILQGDVVQTDDGSTLGLSLSDGTAFNMGASARMVLNELVYDSASTTNSALFSLVKGTIMLVAGQAAKTGDMKVTTPLATMGIRGTAVNTIIDANINGTVYSVKVSLVKDALDHIGSFVRRGSASP